jgi:hypothetical protein
VQITRADGTTAIDTIVPFPPNVDSLVIALTVGIAKS